MINCTLERVGFVARFTEDETFDGDFSVWFWQVWSLNGRCEGGGRDVRL